jgi:hypothetical protein
MRRTGRRRFFFVSARHNERSSGDNGDYSEQEFFHS